jgi:hypothetical protein
MTEPLFSKGCRSRAKVKYSNPWVGKKIEMGEKRKEFDGSATRTAALLEA